MVAFLDKLADSLCSLFFLVVFCVGVTPRLSKYIESLFRDKD